MGEIVIDRGITQSRVAHFEDGKLKRIFFEDEVNYSISGNIYIGRVENIVISMKAAFINIGLSKNALLHFEDINEPDALLRGSTVVVQVIREAVGEKGPRVTGRISIPGKYMVIHPEVRVFGVSKKIEEEAVRRKLKTIAHSIVRDDIGIVLRTEAVSAELEELQEEYDSLTTLWQSIKKSVGYLKTPKLIFNSKDLLNYVFRELVRQDIDNIYFNKSEDLDYFRGLLSSRSDLNHIKLVFDEYNFSPFTRVQHAVEKLGERRVELPSGGYLIIDRTEAAVIIDVNSGSHKSNVSGVDSVLQVNLEAAGVIYDYIRLQNLSGIILIDFINMDREEEKEILQNELLELFKKDIVPARVSTFTEMGLIEISRARKSRSSTDFVYRDCHGGEFTAAYALKKIENLCVMEFKQKNTKKFGFYVSLYLKEYLDRYNNDFIKTIRQLYGIALEISPLTHFKNFSRKIDDGNRGVKVELFNRVIHGTINTFNEDDDGNIIINMKKI